MLLVSTGRRYRFRPAFTKVLTQPWSPAPLAYPRAGAYHRLSREGDSIPVQRAAIEAVALAYGWTDIEVSEEIASARFERTHRVPSSRNSSPELAEEIRDAAPY